MKYKISLVGDKLSKEIKLEEGWEKGLYIGTTKTSHMRFASKMFPISFEIRVFSEAGQWQAESSESIYFQNNSGKSDKVFFDRLASWRIMNAENDEYLFSLEFDIDFEKKADDFYTCIYIDGASQVSVGGLPNCTIQIDDPVIGKDYFVLKRESAGYFLHSKTSRYGVLLNGTKCREDSVLLRDRDILSINGFEFYWNNEAMYTGSNIKLKTNYRTITKGPQANHLKYPKFIRSARQQFVVPEEKISILPPSSKPAQSKKNVALTMMPALLSMTMMLMFRMQMGGNPFYAFMCVGMCLTGVLTSVISYRIEKSDYNKAIVKRENDYNKYMNLQEQKIQQLQEKERLISNQQFPEIEERIREVEDFDARLFEKQREHEDFLFIQLGTGVIESKCSVDYKDQEYRTVADPLMDYPTLFQEKYKFVDKMPIMLDLAENSAVGFVGGRTQLYQMMKNLILQICIEHYYQDVKTVFIMDENDTENFKWARWFRNAYDEKSGLRYFAYNKDSNKIILEYLYSFLNERAKRKPEENKKDPTFVIFVYRSEIFAEHPISLLVDKAADMNCVFLFFDEYPELVNMNCKKRVFLNPNEWTGFVQDADDGEQIDIFEYKRVSLETATEVAKKMASVTVDEVSLEAALTKNITLYQLLNIMNVRDLNLKQRWENSQIYKSMAAPLGVKSGNEIVCLDLHEKFHGPHGLVAGTTGSGKSEIMQSYILSMATLFHPYEVGFIIIDFKGGGMVNQFRDLPHLNGAITNIDGKEIDRSLLSIKAELQKRQRYFALHDVNHIDDYIKLYKKGEAKEPLPHLILIVDEFAELKSEQPEFMKELISAARIGRSLGVHLILATQKPSGVVNDQIWSNSKFKLCLKVQDKNDSNEVLKSPLAAEIREPGRAYLQVGNNEIFQLFQSAYSGAPVPNGSMGQIKSFKVNRVELSGRRQVVFEQKPQVDEDGKNQLDAIVEYISDYCKNSGIERLPNICMPPLPHEIAYNSLEYSNASSDICVPLGMYDAPKRQAQDLMDVNLSQGHVMIVGSSQMGKTTLLTNIIRGLAERYSSDEVQIHLLDYASMILKNFEKLKHVGNVIISTEDDKVKNFLSAMVEEIQRRKDILSDMGLSSYSAYRESGQTELPQIVIMLDNMAVFRELNYNLEDDLLKIARDGAAVGICLICTSMQTNGLGYRYMSNFPNRFCLYCNDSGEYGSVFDRCRSKLDQIPGRCFLEIEKSLYEGQLYVPFPAQKEIERVTKIREFIEAANAADVGKGAESTAGMPDTLTMDMLWEQVTEEWTPYMYPVGINYENYEADGINLSIFPLLGICGSDAKIRLGYTKNIIKELLSKQDKAPVNIYVFDNAMGELEEFDGKVALYTKDSTQIIEVAKRVCRGIESKAGSMPYDCFIMNSDSALEILGEDEETFELVRNCLIYHNGKGLSFILSDVKNESLYLTKLKFVKLLKDAKNMIIFEEISKIEVLDINMRIRNRFRDRKKKPDDAWFVCGDYFELYKTPLSNR